MAKYRQVQTSFWQDPFILDLTPEEKYFYLYLMTNPKTSASGVYELPIKLMVFETGYNSDTIKKLLRKFEEYGKVRYSSKTSEILLVNWLKHNNFQSPKTQSCIKKEWEGIKNSEFRDYIAGVMGWGIDTPLIPHDSPRGDKEYEYEYDKEKEIEEEEEKECIGQETPFHLTIFNHWNSKKIIQHRTLSKKTIGRINGKLKDYTPEEIMQAIDNYARILANPDKYYFTYRWQLWEFLDRGLEKMLDWEIADNNYRKDKPKRSGVDSGYMMERLEKAKMLDEMEGRA